MFYGCRSFMDYHDNPEKVDISNWKVSNDKLFFIFYYCNANFPGIGNSILSKISDMFKIGKKSIEVWGHLGNFDYYIKNN